MPRIENEDKTVYTVVINHEEQYSIWPERREIPLGWRSVGVSGPKSECLTHIDSVWTDMRPLSLRRAMEQPIPTSSQRIASPEAQEHAPLESIAVRLSRGPQPVELILRPARTLDRLVSQLKTGCIHVRFTATRGGTDLAVSLESTAVDQMIAKISSGENRLHISGSLTLDYVPVRCVADLELATFTGVGHLKILSQSN